MAKFNAKKLLDDQVRPLLKRVGGTAATTAYDVFMGVVGGFLDRDIDIPLPGGDVPAPVAAAADLLKPIDPSRALDEIAKAIKKAEQTLLGENLAIHNASVDIDLAVDVGGVAGATAHFNLTIGPTPTA